MNKKEKGLIIKTYDIDYSFIVKNYLSPEMWEKKWNLFVFKEFVATLNISSIDCEKGKISFCITLKDNSTKREYYWSWGCNSDKAVQQYECFSLKVEDINFLKQRIQRRIFNAIIELETQHIRSFDVYRNLEEGKEREERRLRQIAEKFLDDEGVRNEDIREAYIDSYIENNSEIEAKEYEILRTYEGTVFTEILMVFAKLCTNENVIEEIYAIIEDSPNLEDTKRNVEEYLKYIETEEFVEDKAENLQDI